MVVGSETQHTVMPVENLHRRLRVGIVRGLETNLMQAQLLEESLRHHASRFTALAEDFQWRKT
jgi:hypothetical protein